MSISAASVTVFSPEGQLLQVKYACEAASRGSSAVGVRGNDAVVMGVEKKLVPKLQEDRTEQKIVALDDHVLLAFAGYRADARVMITRAQMECQSHRLVVADAPTTEYITRYVAELKQKYTHSNGRRPFGISCLIGGFDPDGSPHLFQTEPSGIYYEWKASAIGRCEKSVRELLEKNYSPQSVATEDGATELVVRALLKVAQRNIQVAVLKRGQPVRMLTQEQINEIASNIEKGKEHTAKK